MSTLRSLPTLAARRTASDEVAGTLRGAIISGQFEDGQELNQVELARHFGVSRVPVREALRLLEAEGLVTAEAHRRVVVSGLSTEGISEIFEVRAVLEAYLLERAAPNFTSEELAELKAMAQAMGTDRNREAWLDRNAEFHHRLLAPAHAPLTMVMIERLTHRVARYTRRHKGGVLRAPEAAKEHTEIVEALQGGAPKRAAALLVSHIRATRDAVITAISNGA